MELLSFICTSFALIIAAHGEGQTQDRHTMHDNSVTWTLNDLNRIGGHPSTILGLPRLIEVPGGNAALFNGTDDGIQVATNPIAGESAFTVEALFRPDAGGEREQRWLHIQETSQDNRILLETRVEGLEWFLDTFIKCGDTSRALYAENFKHAVGAWYHVALVYDGALMRHYVDSREELSGPLAVPPLGVGQTSIGVRMNHVYWFKGAIRKIRFTARALTPQEFMDRN